MTLSPKGLHHVSIVVTDLNRSLTFYCGILGLSQIVRPPFDFEGAWLEVGDQAIHLLVNPKGQTLRADGSIDGRDGHFAFGVDRYSRVKHLLEDAGVVCRGNPGSITGRAQIFCCDPDGNVLEFNCDSAE